MFIHLALDSELYLPKLISMFETVAPGEHHFFIFGDRQEDAPSQGNISRPGSLTEFAESIGRFEEIDGVIINFFATRMEPYVELLKKRGFPIAWYLWGDDAYSASPRYQSSLLGTRTLRLKRAAPDPDAPPPQGAPPTAGLRNMAKGLLGDRGRRFIKRLLPLRNRTPLRFDHVDFFVTWMFEEKPLLEGLKLLHPDVSPHWGTIGFTDSLCSETSVPPEPGTDILLGNSASYTNNHLEAFDLIRRLDWKDRKIIVPLSYGDDHYRDAICREGKNIFGENFRPMLRIMSLKDYNAHIRDCGIVIMNHYRQQAVGNILASLQRGAKVYLNDTTPYQALVRLGFGVQSIPRDLHRENSDALRPLSPSEADHNRKILMGEFGKERTTAETRDLLEALRKLRSRSPHS